MKRAVTIAVLAIAVPVLTLSGLAGARPAVASTPQQAGMAEPMLSCNSSTGPIGNSWCSSGTIFAGVGGSLCMDDESSGITNGNPIHIYGCNSTNAQSWTLGSGSTLQVMGAGATGINGGTANGTKIGWHTCNGHASQVWQPQSDGALLNPATGKCLDDPGSSTTAGTQLQLYSCNKTSAQDWSVP